MELQNFKDSNMRLWVNGKVLLPLGDKCILLEAML